MVLGLILVLRYQSMYVYLLCCSKIRIKNRSDSSSIYHFLRHLSFANSDTGRYLDAGRNFWEGCDFRPTLAGM
jgi:hypothetical protein